MKDTTYNPRFSQLSTSIPKSPTKTSSQKCFKCLGFEHIATNCPSKRTMMVKGGFVMSDHSSQSSKSPTSSKSQSEEECELPCEEDLLVIRCMLGQIQKPFDESQRENINHISFNFQGHKVILKPLSPKEVHEDQKKRKTKEKMKRRKRERINESQNIVLCK